MPQWPDRAIHRLTVTCHAEVMFRRRLDVLDSYEVVGQPYVGPTRLTYVPWIDEATGPYSATRLPNCTVVGLWDALRRSGVDDDQPAAGPAA